jgi:hypothetical protein
MPDPPWSLHPQLAADTMPVGDLALSRLLAINAADYPWLILVPRLGVVGFADLGSVPSATAGWGRVACAQGADTLRQDQYRGDRQCGATAARSYRRAPENRSAWPKPVPA